MVMSPEKYVILRAKVLEMNLKSLEVDGAEEHRLLRGGKVQTGPCATECSPRGSSCSSDCFMFARSARASGDPWRRCEAIVFQ